MKSRNIKPSNKPVIVGNNILPAYFSDFECVNQIHKSKSSYYVRCKGWDDGINKKLSPPTTQGYYHNEYMVRYHSALDGLPF